GVGPAHSAVVRLDGRQICIAGPFPQVFGRDNLPKPFLIRFVDFNRNGETYPGAEPGDCHRASDDNRKPVQPPPTPATSVSRLSPLVVSRNPRERPNWGRKRPSRSLNCNGSVQAWTAYCRILSRLYSPERIRSGSMATRSAAASSPCSLTKV